MEEVVLPEHLLPLGSVLGQGVTALDLCMVLAKIFSVQYNEVALLRLEGGLLRFVFPEYLRTTGAIPLSSKAVAAHTALSKKAEIFNNFARVKHASIFETIKPGYQRFRRTGRAVAHSETHVGADHGPGFRGGGRNSDFAQGARSQVCQGFQPRRPARPGVSGRTAGHSSRIAGELRSLSLATQIVET